MKATDSEVVQLYLDVVHGITVRSCHGTNERKVVSTSKTFGVALESLPRQYVPECGLVPCFMVDACSFLLERVATVGLFRKPGSNLRLKTLKVQLDLGQGCLSTAPPSDVASLIKLFCRELPEPLFPHELHTALLKAQTLPRLQDRTSATQLLSCLLPAKNASLLHYLFTFLSKVSQRCAENLMTSSNLAVVFAPSLMPSPDEAGVSEEQFELRVAVVRTFIENPHTFGVIPKAAKESIECLLESRLLEETRPKKRSHKRYSLQVARTPVRPNVESASALTQRSSSRTKQSLRRNPGLETLPNVLLYRTLMPCTDQSRSSPNTALSDTSRPTYTWTCRTPSVRRMRELGGISHFSCKSTRERDAGSSAAFTRVAKLFLTPWKKRTTI